MHVSSPIGFRHGYASRGIHPLYTKWANAKFMGGKDFYWKNFQDFLSYALSHGYKPGKKLIRIDTKKGFNPLNCKFV
jgi:hypothetical protein